MAFLVDFTDDPDEYPGEDESIPAAVGLLVLGQWHERFVATLGEWSRAEYQSQWLGALRSILSGEEKAVLITEYLGPSAASHLVWWPLFRGSLDTVYVQNHLLFYDSLDREFSVAEASSFLRDRRTIDEDGNKISEWIVSLTEIEVFFYKSQS